MGSSESMTRATSLCSPSSSFRDIKVTESMLSGISGITGISGLSVSVSASHTFIDDDDDEDDLDGDDGDSSDSLESAEFGLLKESLNRQWDDIQNMLESARLGH